MTFSANCKQEVFTVSWRQLKLAAINSAQLCLKSTTELEGLCQSSILGNSSVFILLSKLHRKLLHQCGGCFLSSLRVSGAVRAAVHSQDLIRSDILARVARQEVGTSLQELSVSWLMLPDVRQVIVPVHLLCYCWSRVFCDPDDFLFLNVDLEWEILASRKCYMGGPGASTTWSGVSPSETRTVRLASGCRSLSPKAAFWKVNDSLRLQLWWKFSFWVPVMCECIAKGFSVVGQPVGEEKTKQETATKMGTSQCKCHFLQQS